MSSFWGVAYVEKREELHVQLSKSPYESEYCKYKKILKFQKNGQYSLVEQISHTTAEHTPTLTKIIRNLAIYCGQGSRLRTGGLARGLGREWDNIEVG